jgi:hypothetical protein
MHSEPQVSPIKSYKLEVHCDRCQEIKVVMMETFDPSLKWIDWLKCKLEDYICDACKGKEHEAKRLEGSEQK